MAGAFFLLSPRSLGERVQGDRVAGGEELGEVKGVKRQRVEKEEEALAVSKRAAGKEGMGGQKAESAFELEEEEKEASCNKISRNSLEEKSLFSGGVSKRKVQQ